MTIMMQNLLVFLAVLVCAGFVVWQGYHALLGRKSRVGSCCACGCGSRGHKEEQLRPAPIVFLPVEMLRRSAARHVPHASAPQQPATPVVADPLRDR